MKRIEARAIALAHVRSLLAKGYTVADAKAETLLGSSGAHGSFGYEIRRGKITCPPNSEHVFDFADLAQLIREEAEQPTLL